MDNDNKKLLMAYFMIVEHHNDRKEGFDQKLLNTTVGQLLDELRVKRPELYKQLEDYLAPPKTST